MEDVEEEEEEMELNAYESSVQLLDQAMAVRELLHTRHTSLRREWADMGFPMKGPDYPFTKDASWSEMARLEGLVAEKKENLNSHVKLLLEQAEFIWERQGLSTEKITANKNLATVLSIRTLNFLQQEVTDGKKSMEEWVNHVRIQLKKCWDNMEVPLEVSVPSLSKGTWTIHELQQAEREWGMLSNVKKLNEIPATHWSKRATLKYQNVTEFKTYREWRTNRYRNPPPPLPIITVDPTNLPSNVESSSPLSCNSPSRCVSVAINLTKDKKK